jgi:hypothetical protein
VKQYAPYYGRTSVDVEDGVLDFHPLQTRASEVRANTLTGLAAAAVQLKKRGEKGGASQDSLLRLRYCLDLTVALFIIGEASSQKPVMGTWEKRHAEPGTLAQT